MPLGALGVFVVTIGAIAPAGVAHAQATVGQWTRTGSALTYTFVVPDTHAAGPEDATVDPASGTGEAAQKPPADDAPDPGNDSAAGRRTTLAGLDLVAQRAYLRTAKNSGDTVTTPQVGQSVYFHFDFAVTAPGAASNVGLRAVFDDQVFCSGTQNGQVGAWIQWCLTPWVATAGPHTLRWELDYANEYVESNESNNTATKTWGQACVADCNHDQSVTIDDLITAVNIAFNPALLANCPSTDVSGDKEVAIDEIIMAVNAALNGCG